MTPDNKNQNPNTLMSQLLSPATTLALLGTLSLIFAFYRAGQLAALVVPRDEIKQVKENAVHFKQTRPKVDINSQAVVDMADSSEAAMFVMAGDYKQAIEHALRDLTDNPPDYVPTVLEAGDIISQFGEDKELGFGLLERAVAMAPNNQYVTLRYCLRLVGNGRFDTAEPNLVHLAEKYPEWPDPRIVLSKLHFIEGKTAKATTELIELTTSKDLNSKQAEQVALMLAKLGRTPDAFFYFSKSNQS